MSRSLVLVLVAVLCPTLASAASPGVKCEWHKLAIAGSYAGCRLKAESKAVKKGGAADFSKCDLLFSSKWQRAEAKWDGACPTTGDESTIQNELISSTAAIAAALAGTPARGVGPDVKCQFQKLGTAAKYYSCRLQAVSKAVKRGWVLDFSKCDAKFALKWQRAEAKGGASCPTLGDQASVQAVISNDVSTIAAELAGGTTTTTTSSTTTTTLAGGCPGTLQLETGGNGSDFDIGWTGIMHDQRFPNGTLLAVGISSCAGSSPPCGQCNISGLVPNQSGPSNQRCTDDTSVVCTSSNDCGLGGSCEFTLGQPIPTWAGGVPACVQGYVSGAVNGTVNLDSGALSLQLPVSWELFLGITIGLPCPECNGDVTPEDGVRDGICSGGPRNGLPCDAGGDHFFSVAGRTSLDCPPDPNLALGTTSTGPFTLSTGAQSVSLSSASPNCRVAGFGRFKCMCDTCATVNAEPCMSDSDCPGGATCGGKRCVSGSDDGSPCNAGSDCSSGVCDVPGERTQPNSCLGGPSDCVLNGADTDSVDEGMCASGPTDGMCNIETFRGCSADSDCPAPGDTCGTRQRECFTTSQELRCSTSGTSCFSDTDCPPGETCELVIADSDVAASGAADPPVGGVWHPTLAGLFCMPPVASTSASVVLGLPGLGRITLPVTVTELP